MQILSQYLSSTIYSNMKFRKKRKYLKHFTAASAAAVAVFIDHHHLSSSHYPEYQKIKDQRPNKKKNPPIKYL
ncbi:hypothetical protein DERF_005574 [Dermatophagoides farinae]|uniref:Uncharacterized protein n=1 Tax=Dermatophagoides farinae TaxID=6954 RepID=A0A922I651_DERFA|nr:hypothetical protein DERF_005574 [Dermatophagoides farinae]